MKSGRLSPPRKPCQSNATGQRAELPGRFKWALTTIWQAPNQESETGKLDCLLHSDPLLLQFDRGVGVNRRLPLLGRGSSCRETAMRIRPLFLPVLGWFCGLLPLEAQQAPAPAPAGTYFGLLSLVRYDLPVGRSDGYAPTRQLAQRQTGQDGVDWPDLTLNGAPIFRAGAEEKIALRLRSGASAASPFQLKEDDRIEPGTIGCARSKGAAGCGTSTPPTRRRGRRTRARRCRGATSSGPFRCASPAEGAPVKIVRA